MSESAVETLHEAASVVADADNALHKAETTAAISAVVVEAAQERMEAAEKVASQITEAAMHSELGNRINTLSDRLSSFEQRNEEWKHSVSDQLKAELRALASEILTEMLTEMFKEDEEPEAKPKSSTPPISQTLEPGAVTELGGEDGSPVAQSRVKRRVFL